MKTALLVGLQHFSNGSEGKENDKLDVKVLQYKISPIRTKI